MTHLHTRRDFLRYMMVGGVAVPAGFGLIDESYASAFNFVLDPANPTELENMHLARVTLPPVVEDGSAAPVQVELMNHPMDDDHYIKSIQIVSFNDPVQTKGIFYLSPANGEAFLSTQIRLNGGESTVWVITECNQHGRWATSKYTKVAAGGC